MDTASLYSAAPSKSRRFLRTATLAVVTTGFVALGAQQLLHAHDVDARVAWHSAKEPLLFHPEPSQSARIELSVSELALELLQSFTASEREQLQEDISALSVPTTAHTGLRVAAHPINTDNMSPEQLNATQRLLSASLKQQATQSPLSLLKTQQALALNEQSMLSGNGYAISIQGSPSAQQPWAWQIGLESKAIRFFYFGDYFSMTEHFIGYESI